MQAHVRRPLREILVAIVVSLGAAAAVCSPAHGEGPSRREVVTLAVEDDWPPYTALRADGSGPEGFAVELVTAAFDTQGIDVRLRAMPFARCMHYARVGRVVGCFNATLVQGNRDDYIWHRTPLSFEELAIYGSVSESREDLTLANLEGEPVGYTIGYTYPTEFLQSKRFARVAVKSDRVLLEMLAAGRIRYALLNTVPAQMRLHAAPKLQARVKRVGQVRMDGFWVAFSKQHPEGERLATVLDAGLTSLHASGAYERLRQRLLQPHALSGPVEASAEQPRVERAATVNRASR